jgi:streptogramin lyase
MLITLLAPILLTIPLSGPEPATMTSPVGTGQEGDSGDGGPATEARLNQPFDVAFDEEGNLYLSDTFNHRIRKVDAKTGIISTVAGNGRKGFSGDGGPATGASMDEPYGICLDRRGNLYFVDRLNYRVRKVDASGIISTVAGNGSASYSGDGGPASIAGLVEPNGAALDPEGHTLYIADVAGHRLRAVDLVTGAIRTVSGTGEGVHDGDKGPAYAARLNGPRAVEVGPDGTIYVLERNGNTLRAIDPASGIIRTIAGTGRKGYSGDGGLAIAATFDGPKEMAIADGAILIVDTENHVIRRIDLEAGLITTVAGCGVRGGAGDGGPATQAQLDRPHGVAVGPDGSILIGDTNNHRIRSVSPPTE